MYYSMPVCGEVILLVMSNKQVSTKNIVLGENIATPNPLIEALPQIE
jgi:hypothetical protein